VGVRKPTWSDPLLERNFEGLGLSREAAGVCVTLLTAGGLQAAGREIVYDAVAVCPTTFTLQRLWSVSDAAPGSTQYAI
jgi:hypothetical protein